MKERMLMTRMEYSVLKEVLKYHECGWSNVDGGGPALNRAELAGGDAWTTRCRTTAVVDSSFARHLVSSPLMACDTVSFLFSIR
jgi:hypothetical protein